LALHSAKIQNPESRIWTLCCLLAGWLTSN
jgi:hypothetical protein